MREFTSRGTGVSSQPIYTSLRGGVDLLKKLLIGVGELRRRSRWSEQRRKQMYVSRRKALTAYLGLPSQRLGLHLCRLHSSAPLPQQPDHMHRSRLLGGLFLLSFDFSSRGNYGQVEAVVDVGLACPGSRRRWGIRRRSGTKLNRRVEALVAYIKSRRSRET